MRKNPRKKPASDSKSPKRSPEPKGRRPATPAAGASGPAEEDPGDREERAREGRTMGGGEGENKGGYGGSDAGDDELQALEEAGMDKDLEEDAEPDRDQAPLEEKGPHQPLPQGRRPREGRKGPSR